MRNKYLTLLIIAFLVSSIIVIQTNTANAKLINEDTFPIFKRINPIGNLAGLLFPIINFAEGYKAIPSNITIGITENATFQLGMYDLETGEFEVPDRFPFFLTQRYAKFEAEFPNGNPGNVWFVVFDPPLLLQTKNDWNHRLISNVTVSLTSPPQSSDYTQTQLIRIKVTDVWVVGNMWTVTKKQMPNSTFIFRLTWPLAALKSFGKWSGTEQITEYIVDVVAIIKPFHAAKIQPLPPSKLAPNDITSIPVLVENQGNYNDTFNFRIRTETGYPLVLTNNGTITLQPGQQGHALVGVAVPANVLDTGTLHSIFIDTYSVEQPNISIASQRIFIETQGLYVSEENSVYSIGAFLIFLIILFFFINWRRKTSIKNGKKPEKPWKIPEEVHHLEELKRTDKNAYEQERLMMEEEYKTALLWYKDDKKITPKDRKKEKQKPSILSTTTTLIRGPKTGKKTKKKQKETPKKTKPLLSKKLERKSRVDTVKTVAPTQDTDKQKTLAKIQKQQEKQLRRLSNL